MRLALEADVSARGGYAVTLIRAGDTLHGWRFPAEVLRAAVPGFEGASCFVDHVGWFQQAASLGDLVGVISEVQWRDTEGGLTGRLRLSNTPPGDWMEALIDQIIEDRESGLPVPNVGLSAGSSDVSMYPDFVDPGSGDYHLDADSACINAGAYVEGLRFDYDGDWGTGTLLDIGADEYHMDPFFVPLTLKGFAP